MKLSHVLRFLSTILLLLVIFRCVQLLLLMLSFERFFSRRVKSIASFVKSILQFAPETMSRSDQELREKLEFAVRFGDIKELVHTLQSLDHRKKPWVNTMLMEMSRSSANCSVIEFIIYRDLLQPNLWIDPYDWSPLHKAVYWRNLNLCKALLWNGANIYSREINGNSTLHLAIQSLTNSNDSCLGSEQDGVQIISLLLKVDREKGHVNGHSNRLIRMRNRFGRTPLHYCADLCSSHIGLRILLLLVNFGAFIDDIDGKQRTAFYICLHHYKLNQWQVPSECWIEFTQVLMQFGCDTLNYDLIFRTKQVPSLKQLCRLHLQSKRNKSFDHLYQKLPTELVDYLNRRCLK